ncbi:LPS translocon maturation chaperone LptM [Vibrio sinensis]
MKKSILALFIISVLGIAGCGQTGPLYMPGDAPQNEQTEE